MGSPQLPASSIPSALPVPSSQSIVMKVVLSLSVIAACVLGALANTSSTAPPATTLGECPAVCCPMTTTAASTTSVKPTQASSTASKTSPAPSTTATAPTTTTTTTTNGTDVKLRAGDSSTTTTPDCSKYIDGTNCVCPENSSSIVSFSMAALLLSSFVAMLL